MDVSNFLKHLFKKLLSVLILNFLYIYRGWMNPVPPPSIYIDDNFYEITISNTSLDAAGKVND